MKFRRSKPAPVGRQRVRRDDDVPAQSKSASFAYSSSRSETELNTGRQKQRKAIKAAGSKAANNFWLNRIGLLILVIAVLASLVNVATLSSDAHVIPLTPNRNALLRQESEYQAAASKLVDSSFWNHNKLTIDTDKLSRQMQQQFPELASVTVTLPLMAHRPLFYIQPNEPALILANDTQAFVLDSNGKALIEAPTIAGLNQPSLPVVTDHSGLKVQLNHQALPADDVAFIQKVLAQLAAKKIATAGLTLPPAASQVDVQIAGQPYFVKFNLQNDEARQQVGTFIATINDLQAKHITPGKYVDVRVNGRAYYQ